MIARSPDSVSAGSSTVGGAEGLAWSCAAGCADWSGTCAQPSRPTRAKCDQRRPFRPMCAPGGPRRPKS